MVSQMVMDDLAALEARGFRFAPEEIVRLNCLGLRVERAGRSADLFAAPRVGWAGQVPIHQPTFGSERWCDTYAARWFSGDEYASALLWACAHAIIPGWFRRPEHLEEHACRAAIKAWGDSLAVTEDQLKHALAVAMLGDDPAAEVVAEKSARARRLARERGDRDDMANESMIDEAVASGLGLSMAEYEAITFCRLVGMLRRFRANNNWDMSAVYDRAHADYTVTLAAIVRKHEEQDI